MQPGDSLVLFDIRRYENDSLKLAEMAHAHGATVVLFTDQWGSPAARFANHSFNMRIEAPSAWDSSVVTLFIIEALIASVETRIWGVTRNRMKMLEALFDETRLFRKSR
jgi:DNA-binding MurR/RpiR family transcriptional regulator